MLGYTAVLQQTDAKPVPTKEAGKHGWVAEASVNFHSDPTYPAQPTRITSEECEFRAFNVHFEKIHVVKAKLFYEGIHGDSRRS